MSSGGLQLIKSEPYTVRHKQCYTYTELIRALVIGHYLSLENKKYDQCTGQSTNDQHKQDYDKPKYFTFRNIRTLKQKLLFFTSISLTLVDFVEFVSDFMYSAYLTDAPYCS